MKGYSDIFICGILLSGSFVGTSADQDVAATNTITLIDHGLRRTGEATLGGSPISSAEVDLDSADLATIPTIKFQGNNDDNPLVYTKRTIGGYYSAHEEQVLANTWYGETDGDDTTGAATIIRAHDGSVTGSFSDGTFVYQMNTMPDGTVAMAVTAFDDFEDELEDTSEIEKQEEENGNTEADTTIGGRSLSLTKSQLRGNVDEKQQDDEHLRKLQSGSIVDVLAIYTDRAMCAEVGKNRGCSSSNRGAIENRIKLAETETNLAYELSGIKTRIRVTIHRDTSGYDEKNGFITDNLADLAGSKGKLSYVNSLRNSKGGDLVALVIDPGDGPCGYGNIKGPYSVTRRGCATGYFSFGHELAHGFGCYHDRANSNPKHPYAHGWQDPGRRFRSILGYNCPGGCTRVQRFSNIKNKYDGRNMGDGSNNCARQIDGYASTVANWKSGTNEEPEDNNCSDNPAGWYDKDGPAYNCAWYAQGDNCSKYGDNYKNLGGTANDACCACGGGTSGGCSDSPSNWHDSDGEAYNCAWYSIDNRCSTYGNDYANGGITANMACCECGGGD